MFSVDRTSYNERHSIDVIAPIGKALLESYQLKLVKADFRRKELRNDVLGNILAAYGILTSPADPLDVISLHFKEDVELASGILRTAHIKV